MKDLLEVLLNEPGYYESVQSQFDPALCVDIELRQIAAAFAELACEPSGFSLAQLISRFESVEIGRRIMDLQIAGERGGNYAARVEGAVTTLQKVRDRNRLGSMIAELRPEVGAPPEQTEERVRAIASRDAALSISHFAARRHLTATPAIAGAASGASQAAD
jgi:hypothetical protein